MKRVLDIVVALGALVVLSPLILGIALLIRWRMGPPVFFRQTRPGLHGLPFEMIKFRTMRDAVDKQGRALPDSERLTSLGGWLRSTSLDELPEFWNVLKGEMSLVGPRPLLMEYLDYYTDEERIRHSVKPGITGLAQVSGRNLTTWEQRLKYDVEYVNNRSFLLDFRIIIQTVQQVISKKGVIVIPSASYCKLSEERAKK